MPWAMLVLVNLAVARLVVVLAVGIGRVVRVAAAGGRSGWPVGGRLAPNCHAASLHSVARSSASP